MHHLTVDSLVVKEPIRKGAQTGLLRLGSVGLAAAVAHEVRRVLTPAKSHAEAAMRQPGLAPEGAACLLSVTKAVAEVELVLEVLVGCATPHLLSLLEVCRVCVVDDEQVRLHCDTDAEVCIPAAALRVILLNLIQNAKRAAADGSTIDVTVQACSTGNTALVRIEDSGTGIRRPTLFRLFDPSANGSGVGLPLCRALAEEYGGTIDVQPRESGGTRAIVKLPLAAAEGQLKAA